MTFGMNDEPNLDQAMRAIVAYLSGQDVALSPTELRRDMALTDGLSATAVDAALGQLIVQGRIMADDTSIRLTTSSEAESGED